MSWRIDEEGHVRNCNDKDPEQEVRDALRKAMIERSHYERAYEALVFVAECARSHSAACECWKDRAIDTVKKLDAKTAAPPFGTEGAQQALPFVAEQRGDPSGDQEGEGGNVGAEAPDPEGSGGG